LKSKVDKEFYNNKIKDLEIILREQH